MGQDFGAFTAARARLLNLLEMGYLRRMKIVR